MTEVIKNQEFELLEAAEENGLSPVVDLKEIKCGLAEVMKDPEISTIFRITKAFLRQRYPLSDRGEQFKGHVVEVLKQGTASEILKLKMQLPTIEQPHLELYKDFDLTTEEKQAIFGVDLATVQITEGCSHNCTFCAAGPPSRTITSMPFPAILKIQQEKEIFEDLFEQLWTSYVDLIFKKTNYRMPNDTSEKNIHDRPPHRIISEEYAKHPISKLAPPDSFFMFGAPLRKEDFWANGMMGSLMSYDDSEFSDYCDRKFLHEDGTPADCGDAVMALASALRPIHITTAGCKPNNRYGIRGFQKIVEFANQNEGFIHKPRLSVNATDALARASLVDYRTMMEEMLELLGQLKIFEVLFHDRSDENTDERNDFRNQVIEPLEALCKVHKSGSIDNSRTQISYYSGGMAVEGSVDHDVFNDCGSGMHIRAKGQIAYYPHRTLLPQESGTGLTMQVPKGTRRIETEMRLF